MLGGPIAISNVTRATILADRAEYARGPWRRFVGLMGREAFPAGSALIFAPCTGVHTAFMRFPIDLVYIRRATEGQGGTVVRLRECLRPFRIAPMWADMVVELPAGTIARTATEVGDQLVCTLSQDDARTSVSHRITAWNPIIGWS